MSTASLVAMPAYAVAAILCAIAASCANPASRSHRQLASWRVCTAFYIMLIIIRLLKVEEQTRQTLRTYIRVTGEYDSRRLLQAPLVALTLLATTALAIPAWRAWRRRRSNACGLLALTGLYTICAFVPLYALRIISLHSVDRVLYSGSVRFNWLLELGLTVSTSLVAVLYVRRCGRHKQV